MSTCGWVRKPVGLSMPSPLTKAAASERENLSAMRSASQLSMSKAESSRSRCDTLGSADSSCSGMLIRSICGVEVSAEATVSVAQPEPRSPRSAITSKLEDSTVTTLAICRIDAAERSCDRICSAVSGSTRYPPSAATVVDSAFASMSRPRSASSSPPRT